jgi:hypothetical protein
MPADPAVIEIDRMQRGGPAASLAAGGGMATRGDSYHLPAAVVGDPSRRGGRK